MLVTYLLMFSLLLLPHFSWHNTGSCFILK